MTCCDVMIWRAFLQYLEEIGAFCAFVCLCVFVCVSDTGTVQVQCACYTVVSD